MKLGVIGGGAWGTALAQTMRLAGRETLIWARERDVVDEINGHHTNTPFLPGVALDRGLRATAEPADIAALDVVLMVAPAQHVRGVGVLLQHRLAAGKPLVLCAKGLEQASGKLLGEVVSEVLPSARLAVLSGPSFAADVARGLPTAVTLACADEAVAITLVQALGSATFRPYHSTDLRGVESEKSCTHRTLRSACFIQQRGPGCSPKRVAGSARGSRLRPASGVGQWCAPAQLVRLASTSSARCGGCTTA